MSSSAYPTTTPPNLASTAEPLVRVRGLVKEYGRLRAVDGIDFEIFPGEVFGLLGPNGAGKTTTFKVFTSAARPTAGEISIFGLDPVIDEIELKARLGVVGQEDTLDHDLNVLENLRVYGGFFGLGGAALREKSEQLLAFMDLGEKAKGRIHTLSGGMKRRLAIVRALLNDPRMLLLDEPTTGLDPQVRHAIWRVLRELKAQGLTILLTTHYMEEAAQLADRVGIMHKGKLISVGPPRDLILEHLPPYVLEFGAIGQPGGWETLAEATLLEQHGDRVYAFSEQESTLRELLHRHGLRNAQIRVASLEDVFLKLTGHHLEE